MCFTFPFFLWSYFLDPAFLTGRRGGIDVGQKSRQFNSDSKSLAAGPSLSRENKTGNLFRKYFGYFCEWYIIIDFFFFSSSTRCYSLKRWSTTLWFRRDTFFFFFSLRERGRERKWTYIYIKLQLFFLSFLSCSDGDIILQRLVGPVDTFLDQLVWSANSHGEGRRRKGQTPETHTKKNIQINTEIIKRVCQKQGQKNLPGHPLTPRRLSLSKRQSDSEGR